MKLDIFGKMEIEILRKDGGWEAYRLGDEGKKRKLHDLKFPKSLPENEIIGFVEDVYHEWATPENQSVIVL